MKARIDADRDRVRAELRAVDVLERSGVPDGAPWVLCARWWREGASEGHLANRGNP